MKESGIKTKMTWINDSDNTHAIMIPPSKISYLSELRLGL